MYVYGCRNIQQTIPAPDSGSFSGRLLSYAALLTHSADTLYVSAGSDRPCIMLLSPLQTDGMDGAGFPVAQGQKRENTQR